MGRKEEKEDIKKALKEIMESFNDLIDENRDLRKENKALKSKHYKDRELARLSAELNASDRMIAKGFPISDEENRAIDEWVDEHINAHGGRTRTKIGCSCLFHYEFSPSQLGTFGTIICDMHGDKFQFQSP